jgi:hypothetical protein
MNPRAKVAVLALLVVAVTARAQTPTRTLMYTFQDDSAVILVGLIETPPTARGFMTSPTSPGRKKAFKVTRQEFEQAWRTLHSSGVGKFAGGQSANRTFDTIQNYVFTAARMPNGAMTNFVVPKTRASPALVSLARQFEAYAR